MDFIELTIHTSTFGSELLSDILWDYTEQGVAILDVNDVIELSKLKKNVWDYIDEELLDTRRDVLVKGYISKENFPSVYGEICEKINKLKENFDPSQIGSLEIIKRTVDGDEWREKWKEHFKPIKLGKVVICPEWIEYLPEEDKVVVKIESNMAFGTGEHETTAMCIELLQKYLTENSTVIDVGCGSGILGMTALKLGAGKVIMTDIDELAVEASERNCRLNGLTADIRLVNLLDDNRIKGDIILANIMAEVLIGFSVGIGDNLTDSGIIILSGILNEKKDAVLKAYESAGFELINNLSRGEWCALALKKI